MNIPSDLRYTKDHEWIKIEGNTATVGITEFAQSELGDIVFVEIETLDEYLEQGQTFGTIEAVKTVSDLFMPMSGKVVDINDEVNESPDIVNKDPYVKGWLIRLEVDKLSEADELLDSEAYKKLIEV